MNQNAVQNHLIRLESGPSTYKSVTKDANGQKPTSSIGLGIQSRGLMAVNNPWLKQMKQEQQVQSFKEKNNEEK